jgi:hypothetical protein
VLLGDGGLSSGSISYTNSEEPIQRAVEAALPDRVTAKSQKQKDRAPGFYLTTPRNESNPLLGAIRRLGLFGTRSDTKFIPEIYRRAGVHSRLALLQGLMDSDGTPGRTRATFSSTSENLADGVVWLARSLGGIATKRSRQTWYTYKGERKPGKPSFRVSLKLPPSLDYFRHSEQKKARRGEPSKYAEPVRSIVSIETVGCDECMCISVAAEDSLYVASDFVLTHNTLLSYLAPKVLGIPVDEALILCPAELRAQYHAEGELYRRMGFDVEPVPVQSYETLSRRDALTSLGVVPKLIVCDEAHAFRNKAAKGTQNFREYLGEHPDVRLVFMSATLTTASLFDYAHLTEWALGKENSPLPTSYSRLVAWARIIDSLGGGAHAKLGPQPGDWAQIGRLMDDARFRPAEADELSARELARAAFQARFASAPGVVQTLEPSCDQPLVFSHMTYEPPEIAAVRLEVDRTWELPNGLECEDQLRAAEKLKQIAQGFYYYWDWEGGADGVDRDWLYFRAEYYREVRRVLRDNRRGLKSVGDVEAAIRAGEFYDATLRDAWIAWESQRALRPEPPETVAEWFSTIILAKAIHEAEEAMVAGHRPIIWYSHRTVADKIEEILGPLSARWEVARAGGGLQGDRKGLVASIPSHGTGLNLQRFDWNLILCPPANGAAWEQLIGRTHRQGQTRPVHVRVYTHTPDLRSAWRSALLDAKYLKETQGVPARLLHATED